MVHVDLRSGRKHVITAILVAHDEFWAGLERSDREAGRRAQASRRFTWQVSGFKLSINLFTTCWTHWSAACATANARYAGDECIHARTSTRLCLLENFLMSPRHAVFVVSGAVAGNGKQAIKRTCGLARRLHVFGGRLFAEQRSRG